MKHIYILFSVILMTHNTFAQTDSTSETETAATKSTLTVGAAYSTNVNYYGQTAAEKMPYLLASASWRHYSGFYLTGSGYKLLKDPSGLVSASNAGVGIDFSLGADLSADVSYSHTFYPTGSPFIQAANANNLSAGISLKKWLHTTGSIDYAFGKTNDVFASFGISKPIDIGSLLSPNDAVSITPAIQLVGGTRHFYETYITEKRLRDSIAGVALPPLFGGDQQTSSTDTKSRTSFDLVSYNFRLPLTYNRAGYQLEIAWELSVVDKRVTGSAQTNSFFNASFYYQL